VAHPHYEYQADITQPIDRDYLKTVLNRQIPVAVKRDQQKRTDAEKLPTNEQGFEVAGKNYQVITQEEQE
jgi:hypothetical protein